MQQTICMDLSAGDFSLFASLSKRLRKPVIAFVPLLLLNFFLPVLNMTERQVYVTQKIVGILLALSFAGILMGLVKVGEDYVIYHYDLKKSDNLRERKIRTKLQLL